MRTCSFRRCPPVRSKQAPAGLVEERIQRLSEALPTSGDCPLDRRTFRDDLADSHRDGSVGVPLKPLVMSFADDGVRDLRGHEVLDLQAAFSRDYEANAEKFEFPVDGHWNALGHYLVASQISRSTRLRSASIRGLSLAGGNCEPSPTRMARAIG